MNNYKVSAFDSTNLVYYSVVFLAANESAAIEQAKEDAGSLCRKPLTWEATLVGAA